MAENVSAYRDNKGVTDEALRRSRPAEEAEPTALRGKQTAETTGYTIQTAGQPALEVVNHDLQPDRAKNQPQQGGVQNGRTLEVSRRLLPSESCRPEA